jgi:RNA-directed DNA polymerase
VGIGATPTDGRGRGGAVVVLRAWESHVHGEGRQRVSQGRNAMSEDAPVNTGAVEWPSPDSAYFAVRRMGDQVAPLGGGGFLPSVR